MNRTATLLALTLMLLTGLVLGQLRTLSYSIPATPPAPNRLALHTATRFYAALNELLDSGDSSKLLAVLHSGFADHALSNDKPGSASDLETAMLAVRATFPDLRLQTSGTILGGDLVASILAVTGNDRVQVSGISFVAHLPDPGFDLLRVADGQIIERWASSALPEPPQVETIADLTIDGSASTTSLLIERLDFENSSGRTLSDHEGTVVIIESGSIGVRLRTYGEAVYSGTPAVPDTGALLVAGAVSYIPAGSPFSLETSGSQTAGVLQLRIEELSSDDRSFQKTVRHVIAPGVTRELLVQGSAFRPGPGPFTLSAYMVTLSAGTSIAKHPIAESELVWVIDGHIDVDVEQGEFLLLADQGAEFHQSGILSLSAGQGIADYTGTEVSYLRTSLTPATMLLVTVTAVE